MRASQTTRHQRIRVLHLQQSLGSKLQAESPNGAEVAKSNFPKHVGWYVFQGSYWELPEAWARFMNSINLVGSAKFNGPPGDVYVCDPKNHKGPSENKIISTQYAPLEK